MCKKHRWASKALFWEIKLTTEGYISISYFQEGMAGVKKSFSCILLTTLIASSILFFTTSLLRDCLQQTLELPWQYLFLAIGIAFFTVYSNVYLDFSPWELLLILFIFYLIVLCYSLNILNRKMLWVAV